MAIQSQGAFLFRRIQDAVATQVAVLGLFILKHMQGTLCITHNNSLSGVVLNFPFSVKVN